MNLSVLGKLFSMAMLIAILMPDSPASAQMDAVDLGVEIGEKIDAKLAVNGPPDPSTLPSHSNRAGKPRPWIIDGKRAFVLDIDDHRGSRCTLAVQLKTRFEGHLWIVGVDRMLQTQLGFRRKRSWGVPPPTRGPHLRHGSRIEMASIRGNYFAERGVSWSRSMKRRFPHAHLLLLEKGLTPERFVEWLDELP
jgi:hypothetical protein